MPFAFFHRVHHMQSLADKDFGLQSQPVDDGCLPGDEGVFEPLVKMLHWFDASDPRDHVFGLLALHQRFHIRAEIPPLLQPNYTKSVAKVFRDATTYALNECRWLDLFDRIFERQDSTDLPSWVSNWDANWYDEINPGHLSRRNAQAHANYPAVIEWRPEQPDKLPLRGIELATVQAVTQSYMHFSMLGWFIDEVVSLIQKHIKPNQVKITHSVLPATLCADTNSNHLLANDVDLDGFNDLCAYRASHGRMPPYLSQLRYIEKAIHPETTWNAARYCGAAHHACCLRKFFITTDGRIGIGPQDTQVGDEAVVLYGGEMPFILRRCEGEYVLIGQSYVHGVINGEAVRVHEQKQEQDVLFVIR